MQGRIIILNSYDMYKSDQTKLTLKWHYSLYSSVKNYQALTQYVSRLIKEI